MAPFSEKCEHMGRVFQQIVAESVIGISSNSGKLVWGYDKDFIFNILICK